VKRQYRQPADRMHEYLHVDDEEDVPLQHRADWLQHQRENRPPHDICPAHCRKTTCRVDSPEKEGDCNGCCWRCGTFHNDAKDLMQHHEPPYRCRRHCGQDPRAGCTHDCAFTRESGRRCKGCLNVARGEW
jgi:hypothetical protein